MTDLTNASDWGAAFGLAEAPLFGDGEHRNPERHRILLDGGTGTFMLSVTDLPEASTAASWAWSSDVTHHVGIGPDFITVLRWDRAGPARTFTRRSVEAQLEAFYTFLLNDGIERGRRIVRHMIELFQSVRAAVSALDAPDEASLGVFLLALDDLSQADDGGRAELMRPPSSPDDPAPGIYAGLRQGRLGVELERFGRAHVGARALDLHAALSIRHAGGLIFQQAHFELLQPADLDLLGQARGGKLGPSRGGAHFTPPAIARSIVEQTLASVEGIAAKEELTLLDPACGSGAFLHEALRALRRGGFAGVVRVIGRDISQPAVTMARFVLDRALSDWAGHRITLDIKAGDSLGTPLPTADVVVMNPPFAAFATLGPTQREQMRVILGKAFNGRPDFSMAFVTHATAALNRGGALGCLFPASLLSLTSATEWRRGLAERAGIRFLASIGDFGLFDYALVQVAAAVFVNGPGDRQVLTLWTANDANATGAALRELRKSQTVGPGAEESKAWRLGRVSVARLVSRPDWRLRPPRIDRLIEELNEAVSMTVGDLFKVQQGIRTGANETFLLSGKEWEALPEAERHYFRPAVTNASIRDGRLETTQYVFYPYRGGKSAFATEAEVAGAVPAYFERHLKPHEATLAARSTVAKRGGSWWALSWQRGFDTGGKARIISKYFGGVGGFAVDAGTNVAVVQGYSWYPVAGLVRAGTASNVVSPGFVAAYGALFNTRLFATLLDAFSAPVAGGQYDLSKRYVDAINVPDLAALFADGSSRAVVMELERLGAEIRAADPQWAGAADEAAAAAYGLDLASFVAP